MPSLFNENLKIIYIHIPKTAGMTINKILFNYDNNFKLICNSEEEEPTINTMHLTIKEVKNKLNKNFIYNKIIISIRNPYDRFISIYCMSKRLNIHNYNITTKDIEQFCINFYNLNLNNNYFFKPMSFFCDFNDSIYIIKYENLINDIYNILNNDKILIPHLNKNFYINKFYYNSLYKNSKIIIEFINSYYKEDFINFNYYQFS